MVNTRSGFNRENRFSREETNEYSGDEDNMSVADHFAENVNGNEDLNGMREIERDHEKHRIEQRFMEMNRQISELTSIVRALTDKMSNSREENYRDVHNSETSVRSDMVTGVLANPPPTPNTQPPRRTPPSLLDPQMGDVMSEIQHLRTTMVDGVIQPKILQTQVPLFRGNREKYNEFEHLLKNHLRPHMHKLTEEQKLNYFQSLLRDDAIEFWQTLKITTETTLTDILQAFSKEYAKEDLKEVSKYKFDQMRYDPTTESFADFLTKFKKLAKQAYGEKANDIAETFSFAKLPIQIQNELAMAGKHDATSEEIKTFVQRRCQYAQLLPNNAGMQPLNNIQNYPAKQQTNQQTTSTSNNAAKPNAKKEVKRKFEGNCRYCNIVGHKWIDCRKRLRDESNGIHTKTYQRPQQDSNNQQPQTDKTRYNPKLVCQICGKVGHSARDCRECVPGASAYQNVPYQKQSTTENREFRRDLRQSQNTRQQPYYVAQATSETTQTEDQNDCYDEDYNEEFTQTSKNL